MEQHLELETLGILRQTKVPTELTWMTDAEKQFMMMLLWAGEEGLHKRDVTKFQKKHADAVFNLDVRGLTNWETDKTGRPMFVVLTWKGEEAAKVLLQVAKHESRKASFAGRNS
jgi:hypothetical protein